MLCLIVPLLLIACEKESSSVVVIPSCPPLAGYTKEQQGDVADKMDANSREAWVQMIHDYGVLRENVRRMCE